MNYVKLGKTISYALRHHPEEFHLVLDEEGWVEMETLFQSLEEKWGKLTEQDIYDVMNYSDKKRYEIKDGKIRACYGHSFSRKIKKIPSQPPQYLYHGTARRSVQSIMEKGLQPMNRQYVHLSKDIETALKVGKRHDEKPVVLRVDAKRAYHHDIQFYEEKENVWLSDPIPKEYIQIKK